MKILYDGRIYSIQPTGGINRYFANLISRLPEEYQPTVTIINHPSRLNYPVHQRLELHSYKQFRPRRLSTELQKYYFRLCTAHQSFDLAHPTYYDLITAQPINSYSCPIVLTVHDFIYERFSEKLDPDGQMAETKRKAILAADAIICVSEHTKQDLLEYYSLPDDRISVIYLGTEIDISNAFGSEPVPGQPYYLYIGSRNASYKNFDGLLIAFSKVVSIASEARLCVVGSKFNAEEIAQINELNIANRIVHYEHASDSHLAKLYHHSIALVYPSLYEGFGIPPLEAMACGTAVVAANTSSIPEVVGEAGLLFNPRNVCDLADILLSLLDQPSERARWIAKGYEQAKHFSWDKTASQTLDVYRALV